MKENQIEIVSVSFLVQYLISVVLRKSYCARARPSTLFNKKNDLSPY